MNPGIGIGSIKSVTEFIKQILIIQMVMFLCCSSSQSTYEFSKINYEKIPVLFIHGHGMASRSWNPLIDYLRKSGYPIQFLRAIQLVPNDGPNIDAAENQIAPFVEEFLCDVNKYLASAQPGAPAKTKIDIVSHSMGALSARWYVAKLRPDRVRTWISLAGANHGSNALCAYVGRDRGGADDLCPAFAQTEKESSIQFILNGKPFISDVDETPYGLGQDSLGVQSIPADDQRSIFYITLRTVKDEWIIPDESAILDGAGGKSFVIPPDIPAVEYPPGNIRLESKVRHDAMLKDGQTLRLVKFILELK